LPWYNRVIAAGGSVAAVQVEALNVLTATYAAIGLNDSTCRFNPFCGLNLAAALVPVFRGGGPDLDTNANFIESDFVPGVGLKGDGATKYLNTGVDPTTLGANDSQHFGVYSLDAGAVLSACEMGTTGTSLSSAVRCCLFVNHPSTDTAVDCYSRTTSRASAVVANNRRLILCNRTATNGTRGYADGVLFGTAGASAASRPTAPYFVFARNNNDAGPDLPTSRALGGYTLGLKMAIADAPVLSAAWRAYSEAMGRVI